MSDPDAAALAAAAGVRVTMVVGASDVGKTTLVVQLASAFAARGEHVAVVDADVGQSEIGPPTTLGLGEVVHPITQLRQARVLALEFLGDTSPARQLGDTAAAAGRLVRRALSAGYRHVLVDTGGLVSGRLGVALKRAKIRAVAPDLVIVVQRGRELEPLVAALETSSPPPSMLRMAASPAARRRTAALRTAHRREALSRYFAEAAAIDLPLDRLTDRGGRPAEAIPDALVGLHDGAGNVLGIGRILETDVARGRLVIETPVRDVLVARLSPGRAVWPG